MEVLQRPEFVEWYRQLRDQRAKSRIAGRLDRLTRGLLGDVKNLGGGVFEMRIDQGPGYRLYCVQRGSVLVILLCGGDKSDQPRDITRARRLAEEEL